MKILKIKTKPKPEFLEAIEDHDAFFIVRLKGDIETHAIETWYGKTTEIFDEIALYSRPILCDFGKVMDVDTATVAALIKRFAEFRQRGGKKLVLFGVQGELKGIFEIARLHELFVICATQEEAVMALNIDGNFDKK